MLKKIKDFFYRLYVNSYGFDDLGKVLLVSGLLCGFIGTIFKITVLSYINFVFYFIFAFRFFSKNKMKRATENRVFRRTIKLIKLKWTYKKTHKVIMCKNCGKFIKVPKHQGKIEITCPECQMKIDSFS